MGFNSEELKEILSIFKAESEEHLQKLNASLLKLEKEPGRTDLLEEIFREAHSLKGSARMIGFEAGEKISHALEDLFGAVRKGEMDLHIGAFDAIFAALDAINRLTEKWLAEPDTEAEDVGPLLKRIVESRSLPPAPSPISKEENLPEAEPVAEADALPEKAPPAEKPAAEEDGERTEKVEPLFGSESGTPAEAVKLEVEETIRVTTRKLDDLMSQIGEILVTKIKFDQRLSEVRRLERSLDDIQRNWTSALKQREMMEAEKSAETAERLIRTQKETGSQIVALHEELSRFVASFNEDSLRMTLISSDLQESINRVRMLPLSSLFNLFPRLLRDIVRDEGKEVELEIEGGEIQLDKKIIEGLKDPLNHLLRNAVDHGIEPPEIRKSAGKKPVGVIRLAASQKASSVVIDIEDDGAGLDVGRIREIALKKGFVSEGQLAEMQEQQVMALVFHPGFSTKGIITDLSGRGVGLDVVYNSIETMKGTITISSEPGRGTKFSIKLPVSLATSQALMVRVADQVFAIPLTAVEGIMEIGREEVMTVEAREAILVGGVPTALVGLQEILGMPPLPEGESEDEKQPVVVIGAIDEKAAVAVTEVVGEKEVVVKGLGAQLRRVRNIAGATILGDGSVVLILNVFDLMKSSQKVRGMWVTAPKDVEEKKAVTPEILVADDSLTTRVLEKNILEGSGYAVTLAVDGADALEKLRQRKFDLVVSDVEMPNMNGFSLTRMIRKEEKFQDLPVILVTSLDSEEDKRKGIEAGANAYITKGAFEQGNLLATVKQLL
jgi:two-component system chemotaxis sensor kinase CheA